MKQKPEISPEVLSNLKASFDEAEKLFPSLFMVPNVAQYRALQAIYTPIDNKYPDMISVEFANGTGKTHLMAIDFIGWTMGPEYLSTEDYPPEALAAWQEVANKRDLGQLSLRLTCTADDMKAGGSVHEILKQVFPWCSFSGQDNTKCFRQIDIPHPLIPGVVNHIAVKTFDQPEDKHSGSTCDRIWINENLPDNLWGETSARTRGGGNIVMFATILDHSTYLNEIEDGLKFKLVRCQGHLYENCKGEQITEEMAAEVFQEIGIQLEKNRKGPGYITNGVLSRNKIEAMIEGWMRGCPHQLQARKSGKPVSEGGKIFPTYNAEIHEVMDGSYDEVPEDWPVVMVCDPHPARPDAVIFARIMPSDTIVIVDEWPTYNEFGYYDKIKENRFTIRQKSEIWRRIIAMRGFHVKHFIGDPNRFLEPDPQTTGNLHSLYKTEGFDFFLQVNDNHEYGCELVNQYLYYDRNTRLINLNDPSANAKLLFYKRCVNTRRSVANYARKAHRDPTKPISEYIDERFSCFAACIRYLVVWHQNHRFQEIKVDANRSSDMDLIRQSRIPQKFRANGANPPINTHGRKLYTFAR